MKVDSFLSPFTEIQLEIDEKCPEELYGYYEAAAMKIAQIIAKKRDCKALITAKWSWVASQTMDAICRTDKVCEMPASALSSGGKRWDEIITVSRERFGAFKTSILPFLEGLSYLRQSIRELPRP